MAEEAGVTLALEPEPGMFLERVADVVRLLDRLGRPEALGLTIDVGHLVCTEEDAPARVIRDAGALVANVQIDDMRRGVHEHLALRPGRGGPARRAGGAHRHPLRRARARRAASPHPCGTRWSPSRAWPPCAGRKPMPHDS